MSTGSTGSLFPKWQLAVLIGAPIALGLGYLYYRNQSSGFEEDEASVSGKKKKLSTKDKTISLDGDEKAVGGQEQVAKPKRTPLEEAIEYKNEGNLRFKTAKYNEAIEFYNKAIETCPKTSTVDLSTFYQNRAAAYEQLKKWSAVKSDCTSALELNNKYVKALYRRARACENMNDLIGSLEDVTATCILEGFQNSNTLVFADRVLKELGRRDAKEAFKNRTIVIPSANFIKTYFASFTNDPTNKNSENGTESATDLKGFARASQALNDGNYEVIIDACTEEIESTESEAEHKLEALLLRGTFHLLTGSLQKALSDFDTIINNENAPVAFRSNALIKRASLNVQSEQHQKGFEDFSAAQQLDPNNADVYHQRGQVYVLLEKLEEALEDFRKAVELAPKLCSAYVQKCYAEYRYACLVQNQMQLFEAISATERATELFPNNIESYNILAQILTEQQKFDKADVLFVKAIKMAPTHASLYVHRGLLQLQWNGDITKALEYLNKAIEIDPKCELAYETLGTIQVQRGLLENAVELFEKALLLSRSELEMVHLCSLRNASMAQLSVVKKLGLDLSSLSQLSSLSAGIV